MTRTAFLTVTDRGFFPGTLATVNSILLFHDEVDVFVVNHTASGLTAPQRRLLEEHPQVRVVDDTEFDQPGRHLHPWELKAYACLDLCEDYEVMVGIDSDCLLCASVDDQIGRCLEFGGFIGGEDGDGTDYDASYGVYRFETPVHNPKYMRTSLYFCAVTPENRRVLRKWADCSSAAVYNGTGPFPGHGDEGVLNAVLFAENRTGDIHLLENSLWSQHWVYWHSIIDWKDGAFRNLSWDGERQRSFHCGGAEKYWSREHRDRVLTSQAAQTYPYAWFLAMLWFGPCRDWSVDPCHFLPPESHHLAEDLVHFLPRIFEVHPDARKKWDEIGDAMIDRLLEGIPRALSLGGGSLSELFSLVESDPSIRRYVEIGAYEGGSILALALRFANRDIDFFCVESFMGSLNGTMDGLPLPDQERFLDNLRKYPVLRVTPIPSRSPHAAAAFEDGSIDFLFIDGCHETPAVLDDINGWMPKLKPGGIIAGDDYEWESVRAAVHARVDRPTVTPSGAVWFDRLSGDYEDPQIAAPARNRHIDGPQKLILRCFLSPGDIVMLTATVRDLHVAYPGRFVTDVRTSVPELWENNPLLTPLYDDDPEVTSIQMECPLIHQSNSIPGHFINAFHQYLEQNLDLRIPVTRFAGDVYLSDLDRSWISQVQELGWEGPFWIVVAGGRYDYTAKWWPPDHFQAVVDHFAGRIRFVQCGEAGHWHPALRDAINLVGKTDARQFVRLMHHAQGVLCPVTFAMHLAAAVQTKPDQPRNRPCVVVAGGREPPQWEAYPHHQFICTVGALPCCEQGGCWRSRCQRVADGDPKDEDRCVDPVEVGADLLIPHCMTMITPDDVIRRIEMYYEGGALRFPGQAATLA